MLLGNYANVPTKGGELGYWWFETMATVVTLSAGIFLFFMMINIANSIIKLKKVKGIGLMIALAVFYYLFVTITQLFAGAVFKPATFLQDFVKGTAWLFPSVILMVVHILYFVNISKYNELLDTAKSEKIIS